MKKTTGLALAAALGAGLMAGTAHAQDARRDFDTMTSNRASEGEGVRFRLSLPFGQAGADRRDPRLSFGFTQGDGEGNVRSLDMFSLSLTGGETHLETPFALNAAGDGEGAWYTRPGNLLLLGVGLGVAWAVYENNNDDDDPAPVNNL